MRVRLSVAGIVGTFVASFGAIQNTAVKPERGSSISGASEGWLWLVDGRGSHAVVSVYPNHCGLIIYSLGQYPRVTRYENGPYFVGIVDTLMRKI